MALRPSATTTINANASGFASGNDYFCVFSPVSRNADLTPRVFANKQGLLAQHDYSPGASLSASILEESKKPIVFVGLPIATAGTVTSQRSTLSSSCRITVAASASGILEELDGVITIATGGTIGAGAGPTFNLSLDGGRSAKLIRLGTASSYVVPFVGVTLSFSAGALVAGDVFEFRTTAPKADNAAITAARVALATQQKQIRQVTVVDEVSNATDVGYYTTQINAYETANKRFAYMRLPIKDGGVIAARSSGVRKNMVAGTAENIAFAEVGVSGDTITRDVGSWLADGFAAGDCIVITGTASNNITAKIASLTATVITLGTEDLVAESISAGAIAIAASASITFAEVGVSGDTITRSSGSWITDGFEVGDTIAVTGTASNNITGTISALSATVLTLAAEDVIDEVAPSHKVLVTSRPTKSGHVAKMDALMVSVDGQKRVDLGYGRGRKICPVSGWFFRRSVQWAATIREAALKSQHIPCWRVDDGQADGFSLDSADETLVEYDERNDGGALAARFTCFTTLDNGPAGAFVALSLTRDTEGSLLSRTHNLAVANVVCSIVQAETSRFVGLTPTLNRDGTMALESLKVLEDRVNRSLRKVLLRDTGDGKMTSYVRWEGSRTDVLNYAGAPFNGVASLLLNGTLEQINTVVNVQNGG